MNDIKRMKRLKFVKSALRENKLLYVIISGSIGNSRRPITRELVFHSSRI